jgi:hypothetical protein
MKYKRFRFRHKETIATILVENRLQYEKAVDAILKARVSIEEMIKRDPYFLATYEPYNGGWNSEVVRRMIEASKMAGVGPMASVAAAIAACAVRAMLEGGSFAVVDNGGDVVMHSYEKLRFGIYTPRNLNLGFEINPKGFYSICTSSGTVGHSISFGYADAVTILSESPEVADSLATRIGNEVKEWFGKQEIASLLEKFWRQYRDRIDGILIIKGEIIGKIGNVPRLKKVEMEYDLITRG